MQELLDLILKNIVTNPEAIQIVTSTEEGREVYTISVDPADMGRVIGKNGKVIKAIRALAHVVAIRQGKRFRINLADETGGVASTESQVATADEVGPKEPAETSASGESETRSDEPAEPEEVADVIDLSQDTEDK